MNEEQLADIYSHISRLTEDLDRLQADLHVVRDASRAAVASPDEWKRTDLIQGIINCGDDIHNALVVAARKTDVLAERLQHDLC